MTAVEDGPARRRRARARAALAGAGFDALVVGRPANLAYLSGARRVVVRGSRPFAPVAVLVVGSGELAVQTYSPDADRLFGGGDVGYPQSWDPRRVAEDLGAIEGLAAARRIGVDGMTAAWEERLAKLAPHASVADAEPVLRPLRSVRSDEEITWLDRPLQAARVALEAARSVLRAGAGERHVRAALARAATGVTGVSLVHEGWCRRVDDDGRLLRMAPEAPMAEGERLALEVAVVADGCEAGVGRTVRCGGPGPDAEAADGPWVAARDAVVRACRAGVTAAELARAASAAGWRPGTLPLVHPLGFGPEPPLADDDAVAEGTVLVVQGVAGDRVGEGGGARAYGRDLLWVRGGGAELLTPW